MSTKLKSYGMMIGALVTATAVMHTFRSKQEKEPEKKSNPQKNEKDPKIDSIEIETGKIMDSISVSNPVFPLKKHLDVLYSGKRTMTDNFEYACKKFINDSCYGSRNLVKEYIERDIIKGHDLITKEFGKYETLSYGQVLNIVRSISYGLRNFCPEFLDEKNRKEGENPKIGIYLNTCKEWLFSSHACWMNNVTVVTIYSNLGASGLAHVVNECELSALITSSDNLAFVDHNLRDCPTLKKLIVVGKSGYCSKFFETRTIYELLVDGEKNPTDLTRPKPEDIAVIMYTSGTTGQPKGVMLSHESVVSTVAGFTKYVKVKREDTLMSYLPLAHIFELVIHHCGLFSGCHIGFGSPFTLVAKRGGAKYYGDLEIVKPTIIIGVPRIFDSIKKGVHEKLRRSSIVSRFLFKSIMDKKIKSLKTTGKNRRVMFEDFVFQKVRKLMGGKIRLIVSGGAPLSKETHFFMQSIIDPEANVCEGYGLTESSACATCQDVDYFGGVNNVGFPIPPCEIKLVNVPELGYYVYNNPPSGEIFLRGKNISLGYYKDPEKTKEVFDSEGWFRTGDIARINKNGSLTIIDRKKNLVKLSQGEYVALEHLETIYGNSPFVSPNGICIIADPLKSYIVCLILVDGSYLKEWSKFSDNTVDEILKLESDELKSAVLKDFKRIAMENKKKNFEIIKNVKVLNDKWTPENERMTPSNKLKRNEIKKAYKKDIKKLFLEVDGRSKKLNGRSRAVSHLPKYYYQINPDYHDGTV